MRLFTYVCLVVGWATTSQAFIYPGTDQAQLPTLASAYNGEFATRTHYTQADGKTPKYLNRLVLEASPYLRQHAHNPVDWYPWGDEALSKAKAQNKLIFLSIGYATCHWCHVMERESFDNEAIAAVLNQHFVSIKVDREQNPDVDTLYMTALSMTADTAGWPLTAVLLPDAKPVFLDSYMTPEVFADILQQSIGYWADDRAGLTEFGEELATSLDNFMNLSVEADAVGLEDSINSVAQLMPAFDPQHGGMGEGAKFPQEPVLLWLLESLEFDPHPLTKDVLLQTLEAMQNGGIHDQVGGGFHRYTVDQAWQTPHFEKMLYNQAQLIRLYARAAVLFGRPDFQRVAERAVAFVIDEMRHADGLFAAGFDAESGGGEGLYYLWNEAQLNAVFGLANGADAANRLNVKDAAAVLPSGGSTLRLASSDDVTLGLELVLDQLKEVRASRVAPYRDNKRITSWNALMIEALAEAGRLLDRPDWIDVARQAAEQIWTGHFDGNQDSLARFSLQDRVSNTRGTLQDYSFLALSYIAMFDATSEPIWLDRALSLAQIIEDRFVNQELGLHASTETRGTALIVDVIETYDTSVPSDSSAALLVLTELNKRMFDKGLRRATLATMAGMSGRMVFTPTAHATAWRAGFRLWDPQLTFANLGYAGNGAIAAELTSPGVIEVRLKPDWHINSVIPRQNDLIPTQLARADGEALTILEKPTATLRNVEYFDEPVEEYSGRVDFRFVPPAARQIVEFSFQACNQQLCLAPETLKFWVGG